LAGVALLEKKRIYLPKGAISHMKFYCAPMEGLTCYIYRNAHHAFFGKIDKYFSPFIVANQTESFKTRSFKDILPENNRDQVLVPQLLTNNGQDFIRFAKHIKLLGYNEINLNLGCPYGTVVAKNRGSGFLAQREALDVFLDEVFSASITKISVKTRLGKDLPEEFYDLIEIFNKYPLTELIIHPRIQKDFYKNKPNLKIFKDALRLSKNPVCYNGDLFTVQDYRDFTAEFPNVATLMLGRGLIANPGLVGAINNNIKLDKQLLKDFHDQIYADYQSILFGDKPVLFKMKELWFYMLPLFTDHDKYAKKIKKSARLAEYEEVVASLFRERDIVT